MSSLFEGIPEPDKERTMAVLDQIITGITDRLTEIEELKKEEPQLRKLLEDYQAIKADFAPPGSGVVSARLAIALRMQGREFVGLTYTRAFTRIFEAREETHERLTIDQIIEILRERGMKLPVKAKESISSKLSRNDQLDYIVENGNYKWGFARWNMEEGKASGKATRKDLKKGGEPPAASAQG